MMKTALAIAQEVMRRMNEPAPTSLFGTTDPGDLQLLQLIYDTAEELRQVGTWTQQKRTHSFVTVSAQASYQLPKDFYAPLFSTQWNQDETINLQGPENDAWFTLRTQGDLTSSVNFSYRIFGFDTNPASNRGQFEVSPTPTSVVNLYFEYISRNLFIPKLWTTGIAYTAGVYVSASGQIYKCLGNITSSATVPAGTAVSGIVDGDGTWGCITTPYETILADTDLCLFDADLMKLGVRAKFLEENGGSWENADAEYRLKIDQAKNRLKGTYMGSFSPVKRFGPRYIIPYRWSI